MSVVILPPTIALKSTWCDLYLNYSNDSLSDKNHGFLKFNGENIFSSLAKFEVVTANTGTESLVHLRCCHNKMFLRRRDSEFYSYISPDADEPEEDQSKWTCTLFEPRAAEDGNPNKVRFVHVQTALPVMAYEDEGKGKFFRLHYDRESQQNFYDIIDLESLVILPRHVAFKDNSGRYLKVEGLSLTFSSLDKGDPASWFEVSTDGQGRVQIKVHNTNNYLTSADSDEGTCYVAMPACTEVHANGYKELSSNQQFWPVQFDATTVALKSLLNNAFLTRDRSKNGLVASSASITADSRFSIEELVLSRKIYNAIYDFDNKVTYGETPITMASANSTNNTSKDNTVEFKFKYTESKSSSWKVTKAWKLGIQFKASLNFPFGLGSIETTYSGEYGETNEWEETVTTENDLETTYTAIVPANTSITVSLMATTGKTDVPYSYYQRDVLYNGKTIVYKKDDGIYQGIESKNFHFKVTVLKESSSRAARDVSTITQRLPDPSVDPTTEEMLPLPKPATEDVASFAVKP